MIPIVPTCEARMMLCGFVATDWDNSQEMADDVASAIAYILTRSRCDRILDVREVSAQSDVRDFLRQRQA